EVSCSLPLRSPFSVTETPTPELYTLSLHDALPISLHCSHALAHHPDHQAARAGRELFAGGDGVHRDHAVGDLEARRRRGRSERRSEEHTSELQSRENLVCRLLLEKKNIETDQPHSK